MEKKKIGIKIADGSFYPILDGDTKQKKRMVLTTVKDGQESVQIDLYRGAGETLEEAIKYGASIGITETNPSNDVDGWDAAIKVAALSNVLLGQNLTPMDVQPTGIRGITRQMIASAEEQGKRWKLVCQGG